MHAIPSVTPLSRTAACTSSVMSVTVSPPAVRRRVSCWKTFMDVAILRDGLPRAEGEPSRLSGSCSSPRRTKLTRSGQSGPLPRRRACFRARIAATGAFRGSARERSALRYSEGAAGPHLPSPCGEGAVVRERDGLETGMRPEGPEDAADVVADGLDTQMQFAGDLLRRMAPLEQMQHFDLAWREIRWRGRGRTVFDVSDLSEDPDHMATARERHGTAAVSTVDMVGLSADLGRRKSRRPSSRISARSRVSRYFGFRVGLPGRFGWVGYRACCNPEPCYYSGPNPETTAQP